MSDTQGVPSGCITKHKVHGQSDRSEHASSDQLAWLRLIRDRRWSASQKRQLIHKFSRPDAIYELSFQESLSFVRGRRLSVKSSSSARNAQAELKAHVTQDSAWLNADNHHLLTISDARYPQLLRQINDPPIALFAVGDVNLLSEPSVAIVGSRRPTPVGAKVVQQIATQLTELGIVVTSGMALGVDGLAHQAALQAGASTIAVMGCGLDKVYPSRHRVLFEQIAQHGLLLSEYPIGVPASKYTFPQRNRIVSGLSYGVVIVEAAERSGTLITARLAMEQNREVMVVPGSSVSAQYQGSHRLLQQGAALVVNGLDVVDALSSELSNALDLRARLVHDSVPQGNENHIEQGVDNELKNQAPEDALLNFISVESTMIDSVISGSGLTPAEVSSMLLILELRGLIAIADDGGYLNLS